MRIYIEHQAIKGFNQEWAAVTATRDRYQAITGWSLVTACDPGGRWFPVSKWDDPQGAAMHALETHRCPKTGDK